MRNGIVAIVPLFMGIMILFFVVAFMGGASDTLFQVNKVKRVKGLQENMLIPAAKLAYELELEGRSEANVTAEVNKFVNTMMQRNLQAN